VLVLNELIIRVIAKCRILKKAANLRYNPIAFRLGVPRLRAAANGTHFN
jgi:hypothetical protein